VTDDQTVSAAKAGDADAWHALYVAHAGRLLLWLRARQPVDCAVSADDVASETWLVAARRVHHFHGTSDQFAGWLFGIGRKVAANQSRRGALRVTAALDGHEVEEPGRVPIDPQEAVSGLDWVRSELARLPRRERDVLACTEVIGLDVAATAHALGMTSVAVRVSRHRALKRLRARLVAAPDAEPHRAPTPRYSPELT
jgi:RNA polymerase sigma-70 factor (ECF subfamily)